MLPRGERRKSGHPGKTVRDTATGVQQEARMQKVVAGVTVYLREGSYYLPEALIFTAADSGTSTHRSSTGLIPRKSRWSAVVFC